MAFFAKLKRVNHVGWLVFDARLLLLLYYDICSSNMSLVDVST